MKAAIGVAAVIGAMLALPGIAAAGPVNDLLNNVGNGVNQTLNGLLGNGGGGNGGGGNGGGGDATPAPQPAPAPQQAGEYTPPAHGTNPHAQGTGAVVDLAPDDTRPLPYDPGGGDEDVVVGASRGEQNEDGSYHGHVTILSLFGTELIPGADTEAGDDPDTGPAGDVNALLDEVCTTSGICLTVLDVLSETDDNGSSNSFSVASADVELLDTEILSAGAVESEGNISDDGECQHSTSRSSVLNAELAPVDLVTVNAAESSSESEACNDGSTHQEQDGRVLATAELVGTPLPVEVFPSGCPDGDPNTEATVLPIIPIDLVSLGVCNAEDSSEMGGTQNDAPFGVREALTVLPGILGIDLDDLVKVTTAASESHAQAPGEGPQPPQPPGPPGPPPPPGTPPEGPDGPPDDVPGGPGGPGDGPTAEPTDELPFTGSDMLALALIGFGVMGTGLGGMALADRRRRLRRE